MGPPSKKRKVEQPSEITFDPTAREDYLTGFHKRKVQRAEHARDTAVKRDKEEKVKARQVLRQQRKADLEDHLKQVDIELRKQNPDLSENETSEGEDAAEGAEEWTGIDEAAELDGQQEDYVDEDKYTTVTVEAMGASDSEDEKAEDQTKPVATTSDQTPANKKRIWSKDKPSDGKPKPKKKKFRYESKTDRKTSRDKLKSKNAKAAKARKETESTRSANMKTTKGPKKR